MQTYQMLKLITKLRGPEIWKQTNGNIDYIISTIGSGGTLSGIGLFLKEQNKQIKVVGVEPNGSCIFGGKSTCYISAGAGMVEPSYITKRYFYLIDEAYKVKDNDAIQECEKFYATENIKNRSYDRNVLIYSQKNFTSK